MKTRSHDIRNFAYVLLYLLLMSDSLGNTNAHERVCEKYPHRVGGYETLRIDHANWEATGDVNEWFPANAILTGPAVHPDDVTQRIRLMSFMGCCKPWLDDFVHAINKNGLLGSWRPSVRQLPDLTWCVVVGIDEW